MKYKLTVVIPVYNQEGLIIRALDSIPTRKDIEIIVVNDGSADKTFEVVHEYMQDHQNKSTRLISWDKNKGVSYAINAGLDRAEGEYVVLLGSDDYFIENKLEEALDWLDGTDLIYFDLIDNTGHVRKLTPQTRTRYVGSTKFMRREFMEDVRCPLERRRAEDTVFTRELLNKNPTEKYTHEIIKHYNYPREGSLTWNARHGVTDRIGNKLS